MDRGRRLAIAAAGLAVMLITAGLVLRAGGGGSTHGTGLDITPNSIDLSGDVPELQPDAGFQPGDPPISLDPTVPAGLPEPVATLPPASVATIQLPPFTTGSSTGTGGPSTPAGPAFSEAGVWVVKADGSSPILVARGATAGVAAGGTWVAFVEGGAVKAVRRSDLRTPRTLATGVAGTAASGLPISGGKGGVAFLNASRAVLVDPAAPDQPVASYEAQGGDAVAAEEDGDGRLLWADDSGLHVGSPENPVPADVQRGILEMGYGLLAHVQGGQVVIGNGPQLAWGEIDRLRSGPAGLVAGSGGRVRLRTQAGEDRVLLERAATPVVTATRILYVSAGASLASASLTGTGATVVASAAAGRTLSDIDLLDDSTLVVTVA